MQRVGYRRNELSNRRKGWQMQCGLKEWKEEENGTSIVVGMVKHTTREEVFWAENAPKTHGFGMQYAWRAINAKECS